MKDKKTGEIIQQIVNLENMISAINEKISNLTELLAPILGDSNITETTELNVSEKLCDLAAQIRSIEQRALDIDNRLTDILFRIRL